MKRQAMAVLLAAASCGGPPPPRAQARAALLGMAEGVRAADGSCAVLARARRDAALADACAADYGAARGALLAAEAALDAADLGRAGCEARPAAARLRELAARLEASPPAVEDALVLADALARVAPCPEPAP